MYFTNANAGTNARNVRYTDSVEVIFQDGRQVMLHLLAFMFAFALSLVQVCDANANAKKIYA